MGTETCIKCGKGGNVLVCRSITCVVAIHESCCMPSSLQLHDRENFFCPYCLYKQSVAECCQAKDKALSAERNLALFLDAKMSVSQEHEPNIATGKEHSNQERGRKNKRVQFEQTETHPNIDESGLVHMRGLLSNERASSSTFGKRGGFLRKCKQSHNVARSIDGMTLMKNQKNRDGQFCDSLHSRWEGGVVAVEPVSYYEERIARKKVGELVRKNKRHREAEAYETSICSISEGYISCNDRTEGYSRLATLSIENAIEFKNYSLGKVSGNKVDGCNDLNTVITGTAGWIEKSSKKILDGVSYSRRKSVRWTTEEEEMLKKGVVVFSSSVNKNIPWRKILAFGSNVFHQWRTPLDLQSKWKIISRKEQSAVK